MNPHATPAPPPAGADATRAERDHRLAALLAAAARGDAAAFEAFYEASFAHARSLARRMLRTLPAEACEDLLAEAYFEAWRRLDRFDPARGSAMTWLLTLVRSRALDGLRAERARPDAGAPADDDRPADAEGDDPADRLWRREAGAQLQAALATLSAAERWVLGLAYLRELSHGQIAQATGMPLGTVKSHLLRAQQRLRATLAVDRG